MHLKNKLPVFVPREYFREIELLSKAALMDMVWDLCCQTAEVSKPGDCEQCASDVIQQFRKEWGIVKLHRADHYGR